MLIALITRGSPAETELRSCRVRRVTRRRPQGRPYTRTSMERFENNDTGYLRWLRENPTGYVVNVLRSELPHGVMLHRATCHTIQAEGMRGSGWTRSYYMKICSRRREPLRQWALRHVGELPPDCLKCQP